MKSKVPSSLLHLEGSVTPVANFPHYLATSTATHKGTGTTILSYLQATAIHQSFSEGAIKRRLGQEQEQVMSWDGRTTEQH